MSRINSDNDLLIALSQIDPLTKCLSRTESLYKLSNEIKRSFRSKNHLSILEIDIDRFKLINDEHGHAIGDEVLCSLTRSIKNLLRVNDHLGRIGGEEFIVILPETNQESASIIAERIRKEIEQTTNFAQTSNRPVRLTISIGIATLIPIDSIYSIDSLGISLLKQADDAMYRAKNNGRNQIAL
ncbi:GGDEF domain-containing protein [Polynucleobacter tropicus]|nr:GGDEF domain-containing protein [Polynucleobacter tropicus]